MKKLILPVFAALALGITSCGGPSIEDVKVADIKDACGCSDAVKTVSDVMVVEAEKHGFDEAKIKADAASKKVMDAADAKIMEVMKKCTEELKIENEAMKKCPSFKELEANMKKFENM